MTQLNCENICIAAMARADGYRAEISSAQIDRHLAGCANCRHELTQLKNLASLLEQQERRPVREDLWIRIEGQLPQAGPEYTPAPSWHPFLLLCLFLLGYKLIELIPDRDFGFLFKVVPIVLLVAAFAYLKENPFKINPQLKLEEEEVTR